jgi:hypothetical protein
MKMILTALAAAVCLLLPAAGFTNYVIHCKNRRKA